ncbi:MAG TPA: DUF99 family protein [Thermoplasmata archaeon]|jgi:hypothetical protein|nr:DUF99 family protein [Thermoplasmata archaeon]
MKAQGRLLGIDDAPFRFGDAETEVVGVLVRAPNYVEGAMTTRVAVDGRDATAKLAAMIQRSRFREVVTLVLIDGAALGGFNVVDIEALYQETALPVATVTRDEPDVAAMEKALRARFPDAEERIAILHRQKLFTVDTGHKPLYVSCAGMAPREVGDAIQKCTLRGAIPEPIRIAHIVATAIKKGESHGRA